MTRFASTFFMSSLLLYYIPKFLKIKKSKYLKFHIIAGWISVLLMTIDTIIKLGQSNFIKYIIFTTIMLSIALTGYLTEKINLKYKKFHVLSMFIFFLYLALIILT